LLAVHVQHKSEFKTRAGNLKKIGDEDKMNMLHDSPSSNIVSAYKQGYNRVPAYFVLNRKKINHIYLQLAAGVTHETIKNYQQPKYNGRSSRHEQLIA
jgi:hypothetical protein